MKSRSVERLFLLFHTIDDELRLVAIQYGNGIGCDNFSHGIAGFNGGVANVWR